MFSKKGDFKTIKFLSQVKIFYIYDKKEVFDLITPLIKKLKESCLFLKDNNFNQAILPLIDNFIDNYSSLPASWYHHDRYEYGLLCHSLLCAIFAVNSYYENIYPTLKQKEVDIKFLWRIELYLIVRALVHDLAKVNTDYLIKGISWDFDSKEIKLYNFEKSTDNLQNFIKKNKIIALLLEKDTITLGKMRPFLKWQQQNKGQKLDFHDIWQKSAVKIDLSKLKIKDKCKHKNLYTTKELQQIFKNFFKKAFYHENNYNFVNFYEGLRYKHYNLRDYLLKTKYENLDGSNGEIIKGNVILGFDFSGTDLRVIRKNHTLDHSLEIKEHVSHKKLENNLSAYFNFLNNLKENKLFIETQLSITHKYLRVNYKLKHCLETLIKDSDFKASRLSFTCDF